MERTRYADLFRHEKELIAIADELIQYAEPGYQEVRTVGCWKRFANRHGLAYSTLLDGRAPVITCGDFSRAAYRVTITADLDAVGSVHGGQITYAHLCGHHAQSVHALGFALLAATDPLPGHIAVRLLGCPAEECLPAFAEDGHLPFLAGKQRLLEEGAFFDSNVVLSTHLADQLPADHLLLAYGAYGGVWMRVQGTDLAERSYDDIHSPHSTKGDIEDSLRQLFGAHLVSAQIAPIGTTKDIRIETARVGGIWPPASKEILRVLHNQGFAVEMVAAYAPLFHDVTLRKAAKRLLRSEFPEVQVVDALWLTGMTDLGDVSRHVPTLQLFVGGTGGITHQADFHVIDKPFAYLWPIVFLQRMILRLGSQSTSSV